MRITNFPLALFCAVLLYGVMAWAVANNLGLVGEVALGWSADHPPRVLVSVSPERWADGAVEATAGHRQGVLVASQVRPVEQLSLGGRWTLPLAINLYTGGLPDWPSRLVFLATGSVSTVLVWHGVLGGLLLVLVHRFLRFHSAHATAHIAALLLATDWCFVFYKRALGGTEVVLQAGLLLCLWGIWSRRWGGGKHGLWPIGMGAALGLSAKLTFLVPLLGLLLAAQLLRRDHARNAPPASGQIFGMLAGMLLLGLPLLTALLHHQWLPPQPHIQSHDFPALQVQRVLDALSGRAAPSREGLTNLWFWLAHPLGFFGPAYGVSAPPAPSALRVLGWLLVLGGSAEGWRDPHRGSTQALLRLMSVLVPVQVLGLWLVARDLHHLAMLSPMVAIWGALAFTQLASRWAAVRSMRHALLTLLLAGPWMASGVHSILETDGILAQIDTPTFTAQGQDALLELLDEHQVQRLVACDYELYGVLETLRPTLTVLHGWGAASHQRGEVLPHLLHQAVGGHLLIVQSSAPMVYNLHPSTGQLRTLATEQGLAIEVAGQLPAQTATLYRVWRP